MTSPAGVVPTRLLVVVASVVEVLEVATAGTAAGVAPDALAVVASSGPAPFMAMRAAIQCSAGDQVPAGEDVRILQRADGEIVGSPGADAGHLEQSTSSLLTAEACEGEAVGPQLGNPMQGPRPGTGEPDDRLELVHGKGGELGRRRESRQSARQERRRSGGGHEATQERAGGRQRDLLTDDCRHHRLELAGVADQPHRRRPGHDGAEGRVSAQLGVD
ncbi:hypothetical protein C7S10_19160 [Nocardioides currus]|uniref:Uncharacterized protein n=1 Tax=Nocardioides currus TaxID=2133958 RepID=A0A2R7YUB2_9ACTN|nr:hypothetical protein [Nocardioides currus]PUA79489.1 hypothetical protein C7S10_19160 [Nocardioides currus]